MEPGVTSLSYSPVCTLNPVLVYIAAELECLIEDYLFYKNGIK